MKVYQEELDSKRGIDSLGENAEKKKASFIENDPHFFSYVAKAKPINIKF